VGPTFYFSFPFLQPYLYSAGPPTHPATLHAHLAAAGRLLPALAAGRHLPDEEADDARRAGHGGPPRSPLPTIRGPRRSGDTQGVSSGGSRGTAASGGARLRTSSWPRIVGLRVGLLCSSSAGEQGPGVYPSRRAPP
jgi:hypothetical protein